ncbi:MAG: hypothetical protein ACREBU_03940 [Nitrososphaera sp.]
MDILGDLFWFSQFVMEHTVLPSPDAKKKLFVMTDHKIKLDWDNCTVEPGEILADGKVRFVIRSRTNRNSDYMGSIPVQLRYMLGVDVNPNEISEPQTERNYSPATSKRKNLPQSVRDIVHDRWVLKLGSAGEIWEWTRNDADLRSSRVYRLYQDIRRFLDSAPKLHGSNDTFRVEVERLDEVMPVIYQPAVDSLDNFLREIHCAPRTNDDATLDVEVSLLFNNEQLRKFKLADGIYRWFRKLLYGRMIDVETFWIHFVKDKANDNYFVFESIYSAEYGLEYDTIHEDRPPDVPRRKIKYYFSDYYHPAVFVNTSNHAMAPHDNNHDLWKWEYVPWIERAPIVLGKKSRREINGEYKSFIDRMLGR